MEQRVARAGLRLVGQAVEAQHVEQVHGDERDPGDRHHAHVAGHEAEVGDLHLVGQSEALQRDLLGEREQVGAAGLEAVAGAEEERLLAAQVRRLLSKEAGEGTPDELVRQALLA